MRTRIRESVLYYGLRFWRRFRDTRAPSPQELGTSAIQRIVVVSNTAIGDTLMSIPAMKVMRQRYPTARIRLLTHAAYRELCAPLVGLWVDEIAEYGGRWRGFMRAVRALRDWRPDLVVILHSNEPQAMPLAYLSGARWRFKLPNVGRFNFLLTNAQPVLHWEDFSHGIEARIRTALLATSPDGATEALPDLRMELPVPFTEMQTVSDFLVARGIPDEAHIIGFQLGASSPDRCWSVSRHAELAQRLLDTDTSWHIVVTGSAKEQRLAAALMALLPLEHRLRVHILSGGLPLSQLPALVQRFTVLLTPDTGTMHLAVAVGTPVVALFAVSDWRRSGPRQDLDRHVVIQKWRTCDPCLVRRCPHAEPLCMDLIQVDEVYAAIHKTLLKVGAL